MLCILWQVDYNGCFGWRYSVWLLPPMVWCNFCSQCFPFSAFAFCTLYVSPGWKTPYWLMYYHVSKHQHITKFPSSQLFPFNECTTIEFYLCQSNIFSEEKSNGTSHLASFILDASYWTVFLVLDVPQQSVIIQFQFSFKPKNRYQYGWIPILFISFDTSSFLLYVIHIFTFHSLNWIELIFICMELGLSLLLLFII